MSKNPGNTITAIRPHKKSKSQVDLYLDGILSLTLTSSVVDHSNIHSGQTITPTDVESLRQADGIQRAFDRSIQYLSYRPRSTSEIKRKLEQLKFDSATIEKVITRLSNSGYINDTTFTSFWKENRQSFSPRSSARLAQELRQKGIDLDIIAESISDVDDEETAYEAAAKKARALVTKPFPEFQKKLRSLLLYRGFNYQVIEITIKKLWQEKNCEDKNV